MAHLADESWILGQALQISSDPTDRQRIAEGVCRLYLGDYLKQWQDLLGDVKIKAFNDPQEALDIPQVLSGPASPLRTLIETVARETALDQPPPAPPEAGKPAADRSLTDKIAGILGKNDATAADPLLQPCAIDPG